MLCLSITDVLEAWSDTNNVIDCSIHGMVGIEYTRLYTGTLGNVANVVVYTATEGVAIVSIVFTNTDAGAATVNLKLDPLDGGNDKFILAVDVSLEPGYSLFMDGQRFALMNTLGMIVTTGAVSDLVYGVGWNGVTDIAASKNAIYDQMELRAPKASPTFTGIVTAPTIDLTGGQIAFPAIAVPSADPNTIDDYEKGTITIYIYDAPAAGNQGGSATGYYTKIGDQVTFWVTFTNIDTTGLTGGNVAYFRPLPFTVNANITGIGAVSCDNVTFADNYLVTRAHPNVVYFTMPEIDSAAPDVALTVAAFLDDVADFFTTIAYKV